MILTFGHFLWVLQKKKMISRTNSAAARTPSGNEAAAPAPAEAPAADAPPQRSLS